MRKSHSNIDKSQNEQAAETRKFISHFFLFGVQRKSAEKPRKEVSIEACSVLNC